MLQAYLAESPDALAQVARRALEACHFDPETGVDLGAALAAPCEAACCDCLLSYYNQRDHARSWIASRSGRSCRRGRRGHPKSRRAPFRARSIANVWSSRRSRSLERRWLELVYQRGHRLPSDAQFLLGSLGARLDFFYRDHTVAIFVDGPHHDRPEQQAADRVLDERLADAGFTVIRFPHAVPWGPILDRYQAIFGAATVVPEPPPVPAPAPAFDASLFEERWHNALAALAATPSDQGFDPARR